LCETKGKQKGGLVGEGEEGEARNFVEKGDRGDADGLSLRAPLVICGAAKVREASARSRENLIKMGFSS